MHCCTPRSEQSRRATDQCCVVVAACACPGCCPCPACSGSQQTGDEAVSVDADACC